MADSETYQSTRYHPQYESARIVHSVDGFTGGGRRAGSVSGKSTARAGQYINDAFSFLKSEDYNAYKYYEESTTDPYSPISAISDDYLSEGTANGYPHSNGHAHSNGHSLSNGHPHSNGYHNGHANSYPRNYPKNYPGNWGGKETPYNNQQRVIKIALAIVVVLLLLVVAGGLTIYFVSQKNNSPTSQGTYLYNMHVRFNKTWDNSYGDTTSQGYITFRDDIIDGVNQVFASGAYSGVYNSTRELKFERTPAGLVTSDSVLLFKDPEATFEKESLVGLVEDELQKTLGTHLDDPIISLNLQDAENLITSTPRGVPDPTTTRGTGFTTQAPTPEPITEAPTPLLPERTTFTDSAPQNQTAATTTIPPQGVDLTTSAPVDCVALEEPQCTMYHTTTGDTGPTAAANFANLIAVKDSNCYAETARFVCSAIYPQCVNNRLLKPCRMFCEQFKAACNVPINCEAYPNDDDVTTCIVEPGYTAPALPTAPNNPCTTGQFSCGTDPVTCVATTKVCDGTADCGDGSDETSQRAACDSLIDSPLQCDFSDETICSLNQLRDDNFDWTLVQLASASSQAAANQDVGDPARIGYVLQMQASGHRPGETARLRSDLLTVGAEQCLHFYYLMNGSGVGSLKVLVVLATGKENELWMRTGDQGASWRVSAVTLLVGTTQVVLQAERGDSFMGDVYVDDLSVTTGACAETGCPADQFSCTNGNCQPLDVVCNGKTECGDYSDEINCNCTSSQFSCDTGMCIDDFRRCDGSDDCPDGSDESACDQVCSHGRHKCTGGQRECIQPEWVCDGLNDCGDASDEGNCPTCSSSQFKCKDFTCISNTKKCDGVNDCSTGEDENECFTLESDKSVTVNRQGVSGPLCVQNLPNTNTINNDLCRVLGLGDSISRNTVTKMANKYQVAKSPIDSEKPLLASLETSATCNGNSVVTITCRARSCGERAGATNQIVHGSGASSRKWPWAAAVYREDQFVCGGTVISEQHVLTAAHCVRGLEASPDKFEVLVGTINKDDRAAGSAGSPEVRRVLKVALAPGFSVYFRGDDLAVLELDRKLSFSAYVQPVCLPHTSDVYGPTSECYTVGWGRTQPGGQPSSTLQEAKTKLWEFDACDDRYDYNLNTKSVCAGYNSGYIANCQGDSGGPLMCRGPDSRWTLVGTYSFSNPDCTTPRTPAVFSRVQEYLPWVSQQTACEFDCGNGECLYNNALKCDGVFDCSNNMDEDFNMCSASISCDFSTPYQCGYRALGADRWERVQGMASVTANRGPITDHTLGTLNGWYLYGRDGLSATVSPPYLESSAHCLSMYVQMRGEASATFRVYVTATTPDDVASIPVNDLKFQRMGSQYGNWKRYVVDIPAGSYFIIFVVSSADQKETGIGLDDVMLTPGACSATTCPSDHVQCQAIPNNDHVTCVAETPGRCNFVQDCPQIGTDEEGCTEAALSPFTCDLENYQNCAWRQHVDHQVEGDPIVDKHDWRLVAADGTSLNQPPNDATTPGAVGGSFLLMDTRVQGAGEKASISLKIPSSDTRTSKGCFSFKYWMHSEGALIVSIDFLDDPPWRVEGVQSAQWREVQISMESFQEVVTIEGKAGSTPATRSFIALDDFAFNLGVCSNPSCSDNKFTCSNGPCIAGTKFCDGTEDCDGGEDEPDGCSCRSEYFQCKYSRGCLEPEKRCNVDVDCEDFSDEHNCTCTQGQFRCQNGRCLPSGRRCDGIIQCEDKSDEMNCPGGCSTSENECDNGLCVTSTLFCNGQDDCGDESDEKNCPACRSYESKCDDNSKCYPNDWKCDGWMDCADGSDETNCMCPSGSNFLCDAAGTTCMTPTQRCDGQADCDTMVDEQGCGSNTTVCAIPGDSCDCGRVEAQAVNQIAGGQVAAPGQWPWACALYLNGEYQCGCVVLSDRWVLSAAHCFFDDTTTPPSLQTNLFDYRVQVDTALSSITATGLIRGVEQRVVHPQYLTGVLKPNDVVMIKLDAAIPFSSTVKPVCLPKEGQVFTPNSNCFVIGWGYTSPKAEVAADLREARMRVLTNAKCDAAWTATDEYDLDPDKQLCAGYETALIGTCAGDSGSPLMCQDAFTDRWQLAGVVSGGRPECGEGQQDITRPSVFTKITNYLTWIKDTIDNS